VHGDRGDHEAERERGEARQVAGKASEGQGERRDE
jgi:hypothetical protein